MYGTARGDGDVITVKWNVVKECAGAIADIAKSHMVSVL